VRSCAASRLRASSRSGLGEGVGCSLGEGLGLADADALGDGDALGEGDSDELAPRVGDADVVFPLPDALGAAEGLGVGRGDGDGVQPSGMPSGPPAFAGRAKTAQTSAEPRTAAATRRRDNLTSVPEDGE